MSNIGTEEQRYLNFSLGAEEYGVPLLTVKEVIAVPEMTPIPFTPPHFIGVMNLRGQVISVIDLRRKLGVKEIKGKEEAVIICDLGQSSLGMVVDSVNSVISPAAEELSAPPDVNTGTNTDYLTNVYRSEKKLVFLIDIIRLLDPQDRNALNRAG
jgi:purine-binding chemotaxis protein CheW